MQDENKTKRRLIKELEQMHQRIGGLKVPETERQQVQKTTRQQNKFLNNVINTIPYTLYVIDANDFTIKLANPVARFGNSWENITCYALIHNNRKPCENTDGVCPLEQVKKTKKPVVVEHIHYDEAGNPKNIEIQGFPIFDTEGNVIRMVEYCLDITELKWMKESLRQSEERYRELADFFPQTIFEINERGNLTFANRHGFQSTGYTLEDFNRGLNVLQMFIPEDRDRVNRNMQTIVRRKKSQGYEYTALRKDGSTFPVTVYSSPINHGDKPVGLRGLVVDITNRKEAETKLLGHQKELRSLASQLSLAEERERRRIAMEMHDRVIQSLAICRMNLTLLLGSTPSARFAKYLGETNVLIKQIINETRSLIFELSSPLLYEFGLEAAMEQLTEQMQEKYGIVFTFEDDRQPKPLDNDIRVLLFHMVRELLINITKHAQAYHAGVRVKRQDGDLRITVEDDGVGFDVSQVNSDKRRTKGFGLFSIRERLHYIGGHMEIESKRGSGTQVILTTSLKQE